GRLEYFNPSSTKKEEKMSAVDSMASAINAEELPKKPASHFNRANRKLVSMLKYVVLMALSAFDMLFFFKDRAFSGGRLEGWTTCCRSGVTRGVKPWSAGGVYLNITYPCCSYSAISVLVSR